MGYEPLVHPDPFDKHPDEIATISFNFGVLGALPEGASIVSATISAMDKRTGLSSTIEILQSTTGAVDDLVVSASLKAGGEVGDVHYVRYELTLASGQKIFAIRKVKLVQR